MAAIPPVEIKRTVHAFSPEAFAEFLADPTRRAILRAALAIPDAGEEPREARWLRQGLYNTPEQNAAGNAGKKGILNPCPK